MRRIALAAVPFDVLRRIERHHFLAREIERFLSLDPLLFRGDRGAVERGGFVTLQTEHRGQVSEVPLAGQCHGRIKLDLRLGCLVEQLLCLKLLEKSLGGDHGTEGVRARRSDADFVNVEDADRHDATP